MPKIYYVGPGPDGLDVDRHHFERDGDGVDVDADLAKSLLKRDDFQQTKPTRSQPRVETATDKE